MKRFEKMVCLLRRLELLLLLTVLNVKFAFQILRETFFLYSICTAFHIRLKNATSVQIFGCLSSYNFLVYRCEELIQQMIVEKLPSFCLAYASFC